jgi:shikimate dehydrogenase
LDKISSGLGAFFEVLYNPFPTAMLSRWREEGNIGIDGLDLLIHQAISQVEIFASLPVNRAQMSRSLRQIGEKALS